MPIYTKQNQNPSGKETHHTKYNTLNDYNFLAFLKFLHGLITEALSYKKHILICLTNCTTSSYIENSGVTLC